MSLIIFGIGVLILLAFVWKVWTGYRGAYHLEQAAKKSLANVWSLYKRRMDLIENLVQTVQGAADFEKSTLTDVISARARASQVMLSPDALKDPANLASFQKAQGELGGALSRLLVTIERYPNLKATESFLGLQSQLTDTENQLHAARSAFNTTIERYNDFRNGTVFAPIGCGVFAQLVLGRDLPSEMTSFEKMEGSEQAPKVQFDFGGAKAPAPTQS